MQTESEYEISSDDVDPPLRPGARLRLLVVVNRLFDWSQNFITRELVELRAQGVDLVVAAREVVSRGDLAPEEAALAGHVLDLPENPFRPGSLLRHAATAWRTPVPYWRCWKALVGLRHDRVRSFLRSVVCLFRAAAVAGEVKARNVNLIHAHFLTAPGDTALYLSRLTGVPWGGTCHAMDIYVDNSGLAGKLADARYMTTCTASNAEHLRGLGVENGGRVHTVHHGIRVLPVAPQGSRHAPFRFIAVGRMVEKKGFEHLIRACALLAEEGAAFRCELIGAGPLLESLRGQGSSPSLDDRVTFHGLVPPGEVAEWYRRSDVLVVPSTIDPSGDRDGLPNVCLEAMNHGLPIIASRVSGIPEGVVDGENGWLVPPADPRALAGAMREALEGGRIEEMRDASRRIVSERFSLADNVRRLRQILEAQL